MPIVDHISWRQQFGSEMGMWPIKVSFFSWWIWTWISTCLHLYIIMVDILLYGRYIFCIYYTEFTWRKTSSAWHCLRCQIKPVLKFSPFLDFSIIKAKKSFMCLNQFNSHFYPLTTERTPIYRAFCLVNILLGGIVYREFNCCTWKRPKELHRKAICTVFL